MIFFFNKQVFEMQGTLTALGSSDQLLSGGSLASWGTPPYGTHSPRGFEPKFES